MEDSVVEAGVVAHYGEPALIDVPKSVVRGEPFAVEVVTYGGSCVAHERTEVDAATDAADVRPLDRRAIAGPGEGCPDDLRRISHVTLLVFDRAGAKEIRFHGRKVSAMQDETIQVIARTMVE